MTMPDKIPKVFIAVPDGDRNEKEVQSDIERAVTNVKKIFGCGDKDRVDILYVQLGSKQDEDLPLFKLGGAISMLDNVDAVYFVKDWRQEIQCHIVHDICELYAIQRVEE